MVGNSCLEGSGSGAHLETNQDTAGVVPPILHLHGHKIANPTLPERIPRGDLDPILSGCG